MKKTKMLAPLIGLASLTAVAAPLATTLCSCGGQDPANEDKIICIKPELDAGTNNHALFYFRFIGNEIPTRFNRVTISGQTKDFLSISSISNVDSDGYFTVKIVLMDLVQPNDWIHYKFNLVFKYGNDKTYTVENLVYQYNEYGEHISDIPGEVAQDEADEPSEEAEAAEDRVRVNHDAPVVQKASQSTFYLAEETIISVQYYWYGNIPSNNTLFISFDTDESEEEDTWLCFLNDGSDKEEFNLWIDDAHRDFTIQFRMRRSEIIQGESSEDFTPYVCFSWLGSDDSALVATPEAPLTFIGYGWDHPDKPNAICNDTHKNMVGELGNFIEFETSFYVVDCNPPFNIEIQTYDNLTLCVYDFDQSKFVIPGSATKNCNELPYTFDELTSMITVRFAVTVWDEAIADYNDYFFKVYISDDSGNWYSTKNNYSIRVVRE